VESARTEVDNWKARVHTLVSNHNRVDPEEHRQLRLERDALRTALETARTAAADSRQQSAAASAAAASDKAEAVANAAKRERQRGEILVKNAEASAAKEKQAAVDKAKAELEAANAAASAQVCSSSCTLLLPTTLITARVVPAVAVLLVLLESVVAMLVYCYIAIANSTACSGSMPTAVSFDVACTVC
jgi:multidrug resistance efflux pump